VIVPLYDLATDAAVLEIIKSALPTYQVVGVPARIIAYGGGGIHCITQQMPN